LLRDVELQEAAPVLTFKLVAHAMPLVATLTGSSSHEKIFGDIFK